MAQGNITQLIESHLEDETECRWCFAIDLQSVKASIVSQYDFPDATVLHLRCPRCGGEFSYYIRAWGEDYLRKMVNILHPELDKEITDSFVGIINERMWPEFDIK